MDIDIGRYITMDIDMDTTRHCLAYIGTLSLFETNVFRPEIACVYLGICMIVIVVVIASGCIVFP